MNERPHPTLTRKLETLPELPGVYLMKDAHGEVLYVGKARSLRARVRQYFAGGDGRVQIEALMASLSDFDTIVTADEQQAFILERDLITKYKPRYNIKLKDDKAYLSIRVDEAAPWPRLELVRRVEQDGARYFGPYTFSYELRTLLDIIKRVVPLRTCTNTVFHNRTRPCLEYQIKRCCGPCTLPVDPDEYREYVRQAIAILEGRTDKLRRDLTSQMERAAEDLRFEDAAAIRDRIEVLENVKQGQQYVSSGAEDRDVFALYREEGLVALAVLRVNIGRIYDSHSFSFSEVSVRDEEVVEAAVTQFYEGGRDIPEEIVLPFELENGAMIAKMLSERRGTKVTLAVPQRGVKARLLSLAQVNARQQFSTRFDAEERYLEVAKSMATTFDLRQVPRKVECVDISNLQGSNIVGALTAFFDGHPDKKGYRKYHISQQGKPDDFAAIHEVVTRRLSHAKAHDDLPDLLVIDGGPGQLREALRAREEVDIEVDIVSLAKLKTASAAFSTEIQQTPERIYLSPDGPPIALEARSEMTRFLQRVRDETHRFVITFHRSQRNKRVLSSVLDSVSGVGPERRARLFRAYGSIEAMRGAVPEELARNGRMPLSLAHKVLEALKSRS